MDSKDMNNRYCPDQEGLSAYLDRELAPDAMHAIASHIRTCGRCAERMAAMEHLSLTFRDLPDVKLGFDLAPHIGVAVKHAERQSRWARVRHLAPLSLATAATVALGVLVGNALVNASATEDQSAVPMAMAMFDAVPPGGVCIGFESCYEQGHI